MRFPMKSLPSHTIVFNPGDCVSLTNWLISRPDKSYTGVAPRTGYFFAYDKDGNSLGIPNIQTDIQLRNFGDYGGDEERGWVTVGHLLPTTDHWEYIQQINTKLGQRIKRLEDRPPVITDLFRRTEV